MLPHKRCLCIPRTLTSMFNTDGLMTVLWLELGDTHWLPRLPASWRTTWRRCSREHRCCCRSTFGWSVFCCPGLMRQTRVQYPGATLGGQAGHYPTLQLRGWARMWSVKTVYFLAGCLQIMAWQVMANTVLTHCMYAIKLKKQRLFQNIHFRVLSLSLPTIPMTC